MTPEQWAEYGLAGLAIFGSLWICWKVVERVLERRAPLAAMAVDGAPAMSSLACQVDPLHFQHQMETAETIKSWDDMIHRGEFSCAWKGRDEIRDLLETMRTGVHATEANTAELRALALELRTSRNGG